MGLKSIGSPITCANEREEKAEHLNPMYPLLLTPSLLFSPNSPLFLFHYFPSFSSHSFTHGHMPSYKSCLERRSVSSKSLYFKVSCHMYLQNHFSLQRLKDICLILQRSDFKESPFYFLSRVIILQSFPPLYSYFPAVGWMVRVGREGKVVFIPANFGLLISAQIVQAL